MQIDRQRAWRQSIDAVQRDLDEAARWLELDNGRLVMYHRLLREYREGERSNEHFLAYHEASEILAIYYLWKTTADRFANLQEKIKFVFRKGTILSDNESAEACSNRPRNDGFVYLLAGKLVHALRIQLLWVDGCRDDRERHDLPNGFKGDILLKMGGALIQVECKRPMSATSLEENVETAIRQISRSEMPGTGGVISVDVSKLIEQRGSYLEARSLDDAANYLTNEVERVIRPLRSAYQHSTILGFLGFASIPVVATAKSTILRGDGKPYEIENLRTTAATWVIATNPASSQSETFVSFP